MLGRILTPLSAHFNFSQSPQTGELSSSKLSFEDDELAPEDFARDVLIELTRNSVEQLKIAEDTRAKIEHLSEIQRILTQADCTKNVFRELDGFLVLMSLLSAIKTSSSGPVLEPREQLLEDALSCLRLVFMILSEATYKHPENAKFFSDHVGYDVLVQAVKGLLAEHEMSEKVVGCLASLALHDFTFPDQFTSFRNLDIYQISNAVSQLKLGFIVQPGAVKVLWDLLPDLQPSDSFLRHGVYILCERLSKSSHRNRAILSSCGIVSQLFDAFYSSSADGDSSGRERSVLQKLLRHLLDLGATTQLARVVFQKVVREDDTLDPDLLEVIRAGMKARWPEHFSMQSSAAFVFKEDSAKGLPPSGFTFMIWLWIEQFPTERSHTIFAYRDVSQSYLSLHLKPDGRLELQSSTNNSLAALQTSTLPKGRWSHVALVHYPHRGSNPSVRVFVNGVLCDMLNWQYPKLESAAKDTAYVIGDTDAKAEMSWCLASAYLVSSPIPDDLIRFIQHLGPRYQGHFQDPAPARFLTYEAATSLNMFLANVAQKPGAAVDSSVLLKAVKGGLGIKETSIVFCLTPASLPERLDDVVSTPKSPGRERPAVAAPCLFDREGDIFIVNARCFDAALWKIGGAAVPLRLVQIAKTPHELSRAIGILTDGLKNSWQNSEDMEHLRGYDILAYMLRSKSQLINITGFETLFEFLGLNFRSQDNSTVVNVVAYRSLALDFELWSRTRPEIQRLHLEHFTTLLQTSRYKVFNAKQRFAKLSVVRKQLFALQTEWYDGAMVPAMLEALRVTAAANFSADEAIKPIVSFLVANLHEEASIIGSPRSIISRLDYSHRREKAELTLQTLISILSSPGCYAKFAATLPLTRICLLLLGERPSPLVSSQILQLIGISRSVSASFGRKFELVSGWSTLRTVLPIAWDASVQRAAFDVLLGRLGDEEEQRQQSDTVVCVQILPTILAALHKGLECVATISDVPDEHINVIYGSPQVTGITTSDTESLVEEFITLQSSSPSFRQLFRLPQTMTMFLDASRNFITLLANSSSVNQTTTRILEKLSHLTLTLTLDNAITGQQKKEIFDILQLAENRMASDGPIETANTVAVKASGSIRRHSGSLRLANQTNDKGVRKILARMAEWRKTVIAAERKRLRKVALDLRENYRQISRLQEWSIALTSERGLWNRAEKAHLWRLDETEGPYRIRKKLEPEVQTADSRVDANEDMRNVQQPDPDVQSILQLEIPPWAESYEISSTDASDDRELAEEVTEDKHRRIRHDLEPGDVIEAVATVARVSGVDSSPGLLIFGRTHLYMLDGLVENDEGVVIDAEDAPRRLFFVPGSKVELSGPQRAERWAHNQVSSFSDRTFLFRDVALELYFKDSRSLLVVFLDKARRQDINRRLSDIVNHRNGGSDLLTPGLLKTPQLLGKMSSKVSSAFRADHLLTAQRRWQAREISNMTYISILNQVSGRTPSDATQYPVFPWVLQDYTSEELDLTSPNSYRDLSQPMGALTPARKEAAQTRYENLESVGEKPFHYGTHFSSSMIVCHFLIRLAPFTSMFKTLQGGDWDLPDRLFSDISRAYDSASRDTRGDVRELIPEFYNCPEFLENSSNHNFGVQTTTGERIHDVKLPPWARNDSLLFITLNRRALESDYVSEHLPAWIDLIWGYKQRDVEASNVFHPLSYEGSIDLDSIADELEREATVGIIHNFGQTPRKLFSSPHPARFMEGPSTLPIGSLYGIEENPNLLTQEHSPHKDLGQSSPVHDLVLDMIGERVIPCPPCTLSVPSRPHETVEWGATRLGLNADGQLRLVVDGRVSQVVEAARCTCAAFADVDTLVTGGGDHTVRMWHVLREHGAPARLVLANVMRVHNARVVCVTASRAWATVVSGAKDGSAVIWDLNRGTYVRSIWHGEGEEAGIHLVAINESTGYIATCSPLRLSLHTINARPIASLDLSATSLSLTALAFHEREYAPRGMLAGGTADGQVLLWGWGAGGTPAGEKARWEFEVRWRGRVRSGAAVTALKFVGESMCHGEETGKCYMWHLPD